MIYVNGLNPIIKSEAFMQDIISFFQEIFLMKNNDKMKVGLAQFKEEEIVVEKPKKVAKSTNEVKLSDLMRRAS